MNTISKFLSAQFIRFIFVGILNTIFGYSVYWLFLFFGYSFIISALASTIAGIIFNFKTIGSLVFNSKNNFLFFKFILVYFIIFIFSITGIWALFEIGISYQIAGAIMIIPGAIISFLLNKSFVFKG
jgi:putative flippase GtrA